MASYNARYGTNLGTNNFSTTGQTYYNSTSDGSIDRSLTETTSAVGNMYTRDKTANPIEYELILPEKFMKQQAGYPTQSQPTSTSNMYYPHTDYFGYSEGYWLARSFG